MIGTLEVVSSVVLIISVLLIILIDRIQERNTKLKELELKLENGDANADIDKYIISTKRNSTNSNYNDCSNCDSNCVNSNGGYVEDYDYDEDCLCYECLLEERREMLERIEKLELKVFNGIDNPKMDIDKVEENEDTEENEEY